ncbi:hypothetical protein ACOMHN_015854 [Nucella lapillus]
MRQCQRFAQILTRNCSLNSDAFRSLGGVGGFRLRGPLGRQGRSFEFDTQIRFLRTEFHRRQNITMASQGGDGWNTFGKYDVYAWSLSGIETCVVVKADDLKIAFDMGYSIPQSVGCANVFISHGHIDHIGGVTNHASKRSLFSMKKARYYLPPLLVDSLRAVTDASYAMAETTEALQDVHILPLSGEDTAKLPGNYFMRAFPTVHRVPSQGYILYKTVRKLKAQYVGQPSATIAQLHRDNVDIHDLITTPEIAYMGDTMMDVFLDPPTPDLLRVKLLITEATFLDGSDKRDSVEKARARGHTHLQEIADNAALFRDVGHILLMHFSTKYSASYVSQAVPKALPAELREKVHCATVAKEKTSSPSSS